MSDAILTQKRLREVLDYNPETGVFTRNSKTANRFTAGSVAGSMSHGYRRITIDGTRYYAHRLAWLFVHGVWPMNIDHINGNGMDNRLSNLRNCTHAENLQNLRNPVNNKSGFRGVHFVKERGKWVAFITKDQKRKHLGLFTNLQDAIHARKMAEIAMHPFSSCHTQHSINPALM